ncbi:MAG: lysoplasmalogenase [Candidatus Hydrogenedentota bacterium]
MYKWFAACCVFAAALVLGQLNGLGMYAGIFKQIASTCFIMTAWSAGAKDSRYGKLILAGLCFSWWGDAFLIKGGDLFFLLGLVSFLTAHVLYSVAFFLHGVRWNWALGSLVVIIPLITWIMSGIFPSVGADMKIPIAAYIMVITIMVMLAVGATARSGTSSIVIGAVFFYFSDISVARGQFLDTEFPDYVWGLPLYYLGQLFLAVSITNSEQNKVEEVNET